MRAPDTSVERDATIEDIMEAADHPNQENNGLEPATPQTITR